MTQDKKTPTPETRPEAIKVETITVDPQEVAATSPNSPSRDESAHATATLAQAKAESVRPDPIQPTSAREEANPASSYASAPPKFETFDAFYPYYMSQLSHTDNRRLHVVGTAIAILCLTQVAMWGVIGGFWWLVWAAIFGYGFAVAGNYFIEKKKPLTFTYPAWSLMGDFKMFWEVVTRKRAF